MRQQKTYLLKLWNDSESSENWRASLEDVKSKERHVFASLQALLEAMPSLTTDAPMLELSKCTTPDCSGAALPCELS